MLLFFIPIVRLVGNMVTRSLKRDIPNLYNYRMLLLVAIVELFMIGMQILIYDLAHMAVLTFLFVEFSLLENQRIENQKLI